jgi:hypothetical protein
MRQSSEFYKWGERDTEQIRAREARKGDEIALYGSNMKYGFIPIDDVTISSEVLLEYTLSVGAVLSSDKNTEISVFWENNKPLILIFQRFAPNDRIVVRRK